MTLKEYLQLMPGTEMFLALSQEEQDRWIFSAEETLVDHVPARKITDRLRAIQIMYMFSDSAEDFAILKSQGVDTFTTEGVSVKFKDRGPSSLSPTILDILNTGRAGVGSLV